MPALPAREPPLASFPGCARQSASTGPAGPGQTSPERLGGMVTCVLSLYWADVDAAWERAVAAGAEVIYPLEDQFYSMGSAAGGSAIRSASNG